MNRLVALALLLLPLALSAKEPSVPMVASGDRTGYFIAPDSTLYSWGINSSGQLGMGDTLQRIYARPVNSAKWIWIESSKSSVVALQADSTLWTWGENKYGQLGFGDTLDRWVPTQVGTDKWRKVTVGFFWTLGLRADSTLWAWGRNQWMVLGQPDDDDHWIPTQIGNEKWATAYAGTGSAIALDVNGRVWRWGTFSANLDQFTAAGTEPPIRYPTPYGTEQWLDATSSAGVHHLTGLDGSLWAFGSYSQVILNTKAGIDYSQKTLVQELTKPVRVVAPALCRTFVIPPDSSLWVWGDRWREFDGSVCQMSQGFPLIDWNQGEYGMPIFTKYGYYTKQWVDIAGGLGFTTVAYHAKLGVLWWGEILQKQGVPGIYYPTPAQYDPWAVKREEIEPAVVEFDTVVAVPPAGVPGRNLQRESGALQGMVRVFDLQGRLLGQTRKLPAK